MKFLAITALLVAGTLAMPASNSCPPPGGDHNPPPPPPPPPPSHPSPSPTPSYPPPPNNGGGYYPPPPDNTSYAPPYPSSTPNNGGDGDGGSGNTGGGNSDESSDGGYFICASGLYSNPQCCSADVLGLADLDCKPPSKTPKNGSDFAKICSSTGSEARCCVLPVIGQALLCQDVIGAN